MDKVEEQRKKCDYLFTKCMKDLDDYSLFSQWHTAVATLERYEKEAGIKVTYPNWIVNKYNKIGAKAEVFQDQAQPDMLDVTIHMWKLLSIKVMCIGYEYVSGARFKRGFKTNCLEVLYEQYIETKKG
jgi:hypothetical protein